MNKIRDELIKTRQRERANEPKKEKRLNFSLIEEKRKDNISEKCKSKSIQLSTYEGYIKLKQSLLETHMKYNFELDE